MGQVAGSPGIASSDADWELLKAELPEGWDVAAQVFGAIRHRTGPLSDPEVLFRMIIGHASAGNSLRGTAGHARSSGLVDVSDVALFKRLRNSGDWLDYLVDSLLGDTLKGLPDSPYRLRLLDATCVSKPNSEGTDFRIHMEVSLPERKFAGARLTDRRGGESFEHFDIQPGDVMVGDRAYGLASNIDRARAQKGHVVVRINATNLPLYRADGLRVDPLEEARKLRPGEQSDLEVRVRGTDDHVGRLCIYALSPQDAERSQRRLTKKKGRKQKRPKAKAIESAKYVFVFTTLPRSMASTAQVFAIYRLRWQIELSFKALKTVLKLGQLPHRLDETGRAWILAKLVSALLVERLAASAIPPCADSECGGSTREPLSLPCNQIPVRRARRSSPWDAATRGATPDSGVIAHSGTLQRPPKAASRPLRGRPGSLAGTPGISSAE